MFELTEMFKITTIKVSEVKVIAKSRKACPNTEYLDEPKFIITCAQNIYEPHFCI